MVRDGADAPPHHKEVLTLVTWVPGLPDASREGVARTASKEVAALPRERCDSAAGKSEEFDLRLHVFRHEVMFRSHVSGHRVLHVRLASCRSCFMPCLAMRSFDSPVVPDFIPDVFIPQFMPGLSILSPRGAGPVLFCAKAVLSWRPQSASSSSIAPLGSITPGQRPPQYSISL
jgi:hypothetical protein